MRCWRLSSSLVHLEPRGRSAGRPGASFGGFEGRSTHEFPKGPNVPLCGGRLGRARTGHVYGRCFVTDRLDAAALKAAMLLGLVA